MNRDQLLSEIKTRLARLRDPQVSAEDKELLRDEISDFYARLCQDGEPTLPDPLKHEGEWPPVETTAAPPEPAAPPAPEPPPEPAAPPQAQPEEPPKAATTEEPAAPPTPPEPAPEPAAAPPEPAPAQVSFSAAWESFVGAVRQAIPSEEALRPLVGDLPEDVKAQALTHLCELVQLVLPKPATAPQTDAAIKQSFETLLAEISGKLEAQRQAYESQLQEVLKQLGEKHKVVEQRVEQLEKTPATPPNGSPTPVVQEPGSDRMASWASAPIIRTIYPSQK